MLGVFLCSINAFAVPIPDAVGMFRQADGGNTTRVWCDGIVAGGGGGGGVGLTNTEIRATPLPVSGSLTCSVGTVPVTGTFFQSTQPISGTVTVANQSASATAVAVRCVNATGTAFEACGGAGSGGLTNTELRATPVPVSGTFFQATQPVSIAATVPVSGPLTDTQLRTTAVPVSGTLTCNAGTGTLNTNSTVTNTAFGTAVAVRCVNTTGTAYEACGGAGASGLTNTELRASAVPVSLTSTTITGTVTVAGTVTATNASVSTTGTAPPGSATFAGGSVTAGPPPYTIGQMSALSLTTGGGLRIDGSSVIQPVSGTVAVSSLGGTVAISATALPLPTGASIETTQSLVYVNVADINTKTPALVSGRVPVDGSGVTQPVTGTRLNSGGSAVAGGTHLTVGGSDGTNLRQLSTDTTGRLSVIGTFFQATQPVSGTFWQTTQPVSGSFWQTTQPVSGPLTDAQIRASSLPVSGTRLNSGVTVSAGQSHLTIGGSDGTNLRPISMDTTGKINVVGTFFQATQPVSGTVSIASTSTGFGTFNGTIPAQSSLISARVVGGGSPATVSAGNNAPNIADLDSRLYVNTGHPRRFTCRLAEATTATLVELTGCPVVAGSYNITGWRTCGGVATGAAVPMLLRSGVGVNCVTTPVTIDSCWHAANGCCEVNYNTSPLLVKNGDAICGIDAAVGTKSITVFGFITQ